MQTLVQVVCTPGLSVRDAIANDAKLDAHDFEILLERKAGRAPGWTKMAKPGVWSLRHDQHSVERGHQVLSCRVVNRGSGKPDLIIGDFVNYLLQRQRRRIKLITVFPG